MYYILSIYMCINVHINIYAYSTWTPSCEHAHAKYSLAVGVCNTYTHTQTHTQTHTNAHTHTPHTKTHIYIQTHIYTYTHIYIHIYTHIYIHIYIYTHTHTHTHTYIYTYDTSDHHKSKMEILRLNKEMTSHPPLLKCR